MAGATRCTSCTTTEIAAGALDEVLPIPAAPVYPQDVQRLHRHVSAPDVVYQLPLDERDPAWRRRA